MINTKDPTLISVTYNVQIQGAEVEITKSVERGAKRILWRVEFRLYDPSKTCNSYAVFTEIGKETWQSVLEIAAGRVEVKSKNG